jgi:hypothetical protein
MSALTVESLGHQVMAANALTIEPATLSLQIGMPWANITVEAARIGMPRWLIPE